MNHSALSNPPGSPVGRTGISIAGDDHGRPHAAAGEQLEDLAAYRASALEQLRTEDLLRLVPRGHSTVLDVGARDGHFSALLSGYFDAVTALDLSQPPFDLPRVRTVAGDITALDFPDRSFDVVFCTEVLEHIPQLSVACAELCRVSAHAIVIGVPFRQDTRIGQTTCSACGAINPPYGHVNSFTRQRLVSLFPGFEVTAESYVGRARLRTNALSAWLMNLGMNPWGTYSQHERCVRCAATLTPPGRQPLWRKLCSLAAVVLQKAQTAVTRPAPIWIHLVFRRRTEAGALRP
jgi:hypothetical protein